MRGLMLALVAGILGAVPLGAGLSTAHAAVIPCTQSFAGSAKTVAADADGVNYTWTTLPLTLPASSDVEDINVTYSLTGPKPAKFATRLTRMNGTAVAESIPLQATANDTTGQPAPLTFDDEAAATYTHASPAGTYKPYDPADALNKFDGTAVGGTWRLDVANFLTTTGRVTSWSVTITLSVCDSDGDGAMEKQDNCPDVPNAAQGDADGDGLGNECDADLDGDSIPNATDNCLIAANADQADADGDGVGDACDGDRDGDGVTVMDNCPAVGNTDQANVDGDAFGDACDDDADADGLAQAQDRCPLVAGAATGCPVVKRSVVLKRSRTGLTGKVRSVAAVCQARQRVRVLSVRPGKDKTVARKRTSASGKFRVKLRRAGTYYAVAAPTFADEQARCGKDRSRKVRRR